MLKLCPMGDRYAMGLEAGPDGSHISVSSTVCNQPVMPQETFPKVFKERTLSSRYTSDTTSSSVSLLSPKFAALTPECMSDTRFNSPVHSNLLPKLFVGGLSHETNDTNLARYFERFGQLKDAMVLRDNFTMNSRGFGFVTYVDSTVANQVVALGLSRDHIIDGKKVDVKFAVPKANTPSHMSSTPLNATKCFEGRVFMGENSTFNSSGLTSFGSGIETEQGQQLFCENGRGWNYDSPKATSFVQDSPVEQSAYRTKSFNNEVFSRQHNVTAHSPLANMSSILQHNNSFTQYDKRTVDLRRQNSAPLMYNENISANRSFHLQSHLSFENSYPSTSIENLLVPNKIFVGGLLYATGHESLRKFFDQFGPVQSAEVIYNRDTKKSRGFGFVIYKSFHSVEAVLQRQKVDRLLIDGKQVEVKLCKAREDAVAEFLNQSQHALTPTRTVADFMKEHSRSNSLASVNSNGGNMRRQEPLNDSLFDVTENVSEVDHDGAQSPLARLNKYSVLFEPERETETFSAGYQSEVKRSPINDTESSHSGLHAFGSIGDTASQLAGLGNSFKTRSWSEERHLGSMVQTAPVAMEARRNTFCQSQTRSLNPTFPELDLLDAILEEN